MSEIGHNKPPADAAFALEVDDLFSLLSDTLAGGEVDSDEKDAAIDSLMDDFRKASKDAKAAHAVEKRPILDAGKAVDAKWKPVTEKADRGAAACKDALTPYRVAKKAAKDKAEREAREEAEARQKAAQEALKASDDLESKFAAEKELEAAAKLTAVANRSARETTGLRSHWTHQLTHRRELLEWIMKNDPDGLTEMLNEYARKAVAAGTRHLPGVSIIQQQRAA